MVKAENIEIQNFKGDFARNNEDPPGSKVIPTPNAYITDKVWNELVPSFYKGLSDLPLIKDHPELWMVLTFDGYGSHLQGDTLKIFADYKILIVK